ncbi:hypothetical protein SCAR479_07775 [Seiridium cardinale]|uniref:GATA-type domain-containing protein n=1 Tax=Seiridium cardinale TaxID=138064 RepID=A0ABR2XPD0_9PEZI
MSTMPYTEEEIEAAEALLMMSRWIEYDAHLQLPEDRKDCFSLYRDDIGPDYLALGSTNNQVQGPARIPSESPRPGPSPPVFEYDMADAILNSKPPSGEFDCVANPENLYSRLDESVADRGQTAKATRGAKRALEAVDPEPVRESRRQQRPTKKARSSSTALAGPRTSSLKGRAQSAVPPTGISRSAPKHSPGHTRNMLEDEVDKKLREKMEEHGLLAANESPTDEDKRKAKSAEKAIREYKRAKSSLENGQEQEHACSNCLKNGGWPCIVWRSRDGQKVSKCSRCILLKISCSSDGGRRRKEVIGQEPVWDGL